VPEWASSYIDYKSLKKLIKSAARSQIQEQGTGPDLAGMSLVCMLASLS
jgi:SPX domain protein involved in polyphosphate accumulation